MKGNEIQWTDHGNENDMKWHEWIEMKRNEMKWNEWTDEWINEWMNECMHEWTNEWMNGWMNERLNEVNEMKWNDVKWKWN